MLSRLPLRRFRPFASSLGATQSNSADTSASHVDTHQQNTTAASTPVTQSSLARSKPPSKATTASPASASFLTDYRTERAQSRWNAARRHTQAATSASLRTAASQGTTSTSSASSSSHIVPSAVVRPLLQRIMQGKNKVVVLHPEGSQVVTLDLSIQLSEPASNGLPSSSSVTGTTAPSQPKRVSTVVVKSMAREEKEVASKTLDRIRLLFAPPRPSRNNSKRITKEQIFADCPTVRAFCRSSDLARVAEADSSLAAPGAKSAVLPSLSETAPYTELNPVLPNSVFWKHAQVLCVNETNVRVLYNVPTITSLTSPGIPYVGLPLACADVSLLFASKERVCYEWCVLSEASASSRSPTHGDATFRVVGTAPTFTPTSDLQGKAMMLRVSLDPATGLWTEMRLPGVVRQLPPPVSRWQETVTDVNYPAFRVVTYNILYDDFCTSKNSKAKIYPFASDEVLDLENRKVRIAQELLAYHADLVCLQECGRDVFQGYFLPVMRACGYDGVYCNKSGSVKEGCGFLFRESRFHLVESASVPLNFQTLSSMFPDLAGRVGACPELKEALSTVTTIGARVVLRETTSDKEVVVGNTHLFYHANACHIRILQAYMLLHWLHEASLIPPGGDAVASPSSSFADHAPPHRPVVMCGDFNCTHPTGAYRLLTTGQVEANHPSWDKGKLFWWGCARLLGYEAENLGELLDRDAVLPQTRVARKSPTQQQKSPAETAKPTTTKLADVPVEASNETQGQEESAQREYGERVITKVFHEALYGPQMHLQDAYQRTDLSLPWTNFTLTFREVIDYIFFSEDSLEVLRTVPIPPEAELAENFALPNKKYPSDHIALVADLAFTT
ncbi:conserved hypothetical protein [Leishmania braziliensis MHOM/BR/75/M2904]|uniref:Endonuclease/exonuclease/phosphatase domain-containing protein n=2 Tax=Leishmania braziliensis TaxID=5660 RepID=A4HAT4_LEIBR|nr:conserved hypothetical protein [Leishmania braziliensis MHOM/BR/75/M2904]KAI5686456.1 Endonuclease [Leishmania braziliensis]CAJ2471373.1 unnamed protein product [Leishmania braziliensis]CAM38518.1 conserved hypothetical protein [Leishmania braziliensis MHOM/BR/75/M2904]